MPVYNAENLFESYENNLRRRELLKKNNSLSKEDVDKIEELTEILSGIRGTFYKDQTLGVTDKEVNTRINEIKSMIREEVWTS